MRRYLLLLFLTALVGGVAEWMVPDERGEEGRRPVRLVASICLLCVFLSPIRQLPQIGEQLAGQVHELLDSTEREEALDEQFRANMTAVETAEVVRLLGAELGERFGVDAGSFTVTLTAKPRTEDGSAGGIETVSVRLRGAALFLDPARVEETVQNLLGCPCTVYY